MHNGRLGVEERYNCGYLFEYRWVLVLPDEDITLVNVQESADNEMFDVDALNDSTTVTTVTITTEEITLAQALEALKTLKPKVKRIVFQEPGKSTTTTTISSQQSQDMGKGIMIEEPVKPMKKKHQISFDEEGKIEVDYQLDERMKTQEQEELSNAKKATLFQQLLKKRRKHFAAKRAEEQRNKPPPQAQQIKIIAFKRVNTFVNFKTDLVEGSSKRAGEELE
ncbi:hypothetical protein Tco_1320783 [Tanacetum coccineum]